MFPHLGKVNLFSILAPGFYILFVLSVAFLHFEETGFSYSLKEATHKLIPSVVDSSTNARVTIWLVGIAFGSYLIGITLRAFPVGWSDDFCAWLRHFRHRFVRSKLYRFRRWLYQSKQARRAQIESQANILRTQIADDVAKKHSTESTIELRKKLRKLNKRKKQMGLFPSGILLTILKPYCLRRYYREDFPYPSLIKQVLRNLNQARSTAPLPYEDERGLHLLFNHWKVVICDRDSKAFALSQNVEGEVRLFAGMFWAGVVGFLTPTFAALYSYFNKPENFDKLWEVDIFLISISGIVALCFAWWLREFRKAEVRVVLLALLNSAPQKLLSIADETEN